MKKTFEENPKGAFETDLYFRVDCDQSIDDELLKDDSDQCFLNS